MMGGMKHYSGMNMGAMGMPFEHVEGRIAFLQTEIGITDAQREQWAVSPPLCAGMPRFTGPCIIR